MKKPTRDPIYLAFIRSLPCTIRGLSWGIEAAHTGPHGLGQKSSDYSAIPLCRKHHRTSNDSLHKLGPFRFMTVHQLEIPELVKRLNAKPIIRIEAGCFVGIFQGQERIEYVLGPAVYERLIPAAEQMRKRRLEEMRSR